jgi:omega-amidase
MKLNLIQYSPEWEDKTKNREKIIRILNENCRNSLLIFPEMTLTGFTMNPAEHAEALKGESFKFFAELAVRYEANILAGIIELKKKEFFNSMLAINTDGELKSTYRKIHPFSFSSEDKFYSPGKKTVVADLNGWKIGLSICYDLRFPELYRKYGKERTELIVDIANWPVTRIEHWRTLLKARAIENQCYVAGVNRTGCDPKLQYNGYSSVFDPMGKELITMYDDEGIVTAEVDKDYVEEIRTKLPFLNDMVMI